MGYIIYFGFLRMIIQRCVPNTARFCIYIYITYFAYACVIPNFVDPFSASPDWTAITIGQVEITNGTKYGGWFKNPTNLTGMMMRDQGDAFC